MAVSIVGQAHTGSRLDRWTGTPGFWTGTPGFIRIATPPDLSEPIFQPSRLIHGRRGPTVWRVHGSAFVLRLILIAFLANVGLCPCAPLAAEPAAEKSAKALHHDTGHDGHFAAMTDPTSTHEDETCHTDSSVDECGMDASAEPDFRAPQADRTDDPACNAEIRTVSLATPTARAGPSGHAEPGWRPADTPIILHDRLLI
jgi:hypothetical protein